MIFESIITVGWRQTQKPSALLMIYSGDDVEAAVAAANAALDGAIVQYVRVFRGPFPAGGQLLYAGSEKSRPQLPGPVVPATGRSSVSPTVRANS